MATSGAEALAFCAQQLPDLILLDVLMPEMSGYEVCDRLKADPFMAKVDIDAVVAAGNFAGRAPEQVDEYLSEVVEPALEPYRKSLGQKAELHV